MWCQPWTRLRIGKCAYDFAYTNGLIHFVLPCATCRQTKKDLESRVVLGFGLRKQ